MTNEQIAHVCHDANRALCATHGDLSQPPWDEAPAWQRESAIHGVEFCQSHQDAPASANHDSWLREKLAAGWTYGPVKDAVAKTHPCLVPFEQLPSEQQAKDALFKAVVGALAGHAR